MGPETTVRRPLTAKIDRASSLVRRFLDERFSAGLCDVQRRYREAALLLAVPSADRREANPGTIGTATDWLLRFMLCPDRHCIFQLWGRPFLGSGPD